MPAIRSFAVALGLAIAGPALADGITVKDGYVRASVGGAPTAAAFLTLTNATGEDDRLVGADTPAAARSELHTHDEDDAGVMRMRHVEEGFALPAGGTLTLEPGGHHVMMMGLAQPLAEGDAVELTLHFERQGDVEVTLPVRPMGGAAADR